MIWQAYQHTDIAGLANATEKVDRKTGRVEEDLRNTQRQVERLSLVCQAMWELLREQADFKDEDLEEKILEIDLRDGKINGRIRVTILECGNCGRKTNSKRTNCIMCGAPIERPHQFEP